MQHAACRYDSFRHHYQPRLDNDQDLHLGYGWPYRGELSNDCTRTVQASNVHRHLCGGASE